jgi:hypothetical protein
MLPNEAPMIDADPSVRWGPKKETPGGQFLCEAARAFHVPTWVGIWQVVFLRLRMATSDVALYRTGISELCDIEATSMTDEIDAKSNFQSYLCTVCN